MVWLLYSLYQRKGGGDHAQAGCLGQEVTANGVLLQLLICFSHEKVQYNA